MNKYQRGGTVIHDVDTGRDVPNITYVPTLELPELKTSPLTSAIDTYVKIKDQEIETTKNNLAGVTAAYDAVTKVRYDNTKQQAEIVAARERSGLTEDAFNMSSEQLKNPYIMGPIARATTGFTNDPAIRDIVREQVMFDATLAEFQKKPPGNPILRDMFVKDIDKYRNGELSGLDLNLGQYADIDIGAVLGKRLSELPVIKTSELVDDPYTSYEKQVSNRSEKAVAAVLAEQLSNPVFLNNMIARGFMTPDKQLTTTGSKYMDDLRDAYTAHSIEISGIKGKPSSATKNYGTDPTPSATAGLTGITGQLYNGYYNIAAGYGIPLDDATNSDRVGLNQRVLIELNNSAKSTTKEDSETVRSRVVGAIRKEAITKGGDGVRALYDEAVDKGYLGTMEDLAAIVATNDWTSMTTGGQLEAYPKIKEALSSLGGAGGEEFIFNSVKKPRAYNTQSRYEGGEAPSTGGGSMRGKKLTEFFLDESPSSVQQNGNTGLPFANDYASRAFTPESSNRPNADNSKSTAYGYGQFLDETWLEVTKGYKEMQGKSREERLALRTDKNLNIKATNDYAARNQKALLANKIAPDYLNTHITHRFGTSGGVKVIKAFEKFPNKPIDQVVSARVMADNPDLYYKDGPKKGKPKTLIDVMHDNAEKIGMYTSRTFNNNSSKWYKSWDEVSDGSDRVDKNVVAVLDMLSDTIGQKVKINDAHRDYTTNANTKDSGEESQHMFGTAADISLRGLSTKQRQALLQKMLALGAKGIGFYSGDNYMHFDLRNTGDIATWGPAPDWAKGIMR